MGVLDTAKDVITLVQKIDNIELLKQILSLQADIQKLYGEYLALREQVASLTEKLRIKRALRFRPYTKTGTPRTVDLSVELCNTVRLHLAELREKGSIRTMSLALTNMER